MTLSSAGLRRESGSEDSTVSEMRSAIERGAFTSALVRQCWEEARSRRLGRDDTCVLLAYEALARLEEFHRQYEDLKATQDANRTLNFEFDGHF
jgi:hypothetical protein